ncbi:asparagine--tRNA ligase, cytoplasmic-like [Haliotis rubra]|uniref:asparagine--tRNA ligase, cytoplasmic-like n=1 Tax=Haliotis rubra TaxID=36100 RepID=UPI001EE5FAAB|nr:asparagine--tRNA ligase, cytoplasmic-like [Haliotis rubra]
MSTGDIYTSEKRGDDKEGGGTKEKPFKTVLQAMRHVGGEPFPTIHVDPRDETKSGTDYDVISKSQYKKCLKLWQKEQSSAEYKSTREAEDAMRTERNLAETRKVTIKMDTTLPKPKLIRIREATRNRNTRVKVEGWVHRLRRQGKNLMFVVLRDGSGFLQCVLHDVQCQTYEALTLATEATIAVFGVIKELPAGKTAPDSHELYADYWELIGTSPAGGADNLLNEEVHVDVQLDNRHMMLRGENVMRWGSLVVKAFTRHANDRGYYKYYIASVIFSRVMNDTLLSPQAYLTPSSQLYLETCLPSLGDVFCIAQSYRPESSKTRRHLAEYTHVEGECSFIDFDGLLDRLEDLVCDVVDRVLKSPYGQIVYELNPDFQPPKKPFRRMQYTEALTYLKEHDIKKEDGSWYEFGDDIPEAPERKMTDQINEPIFLCRFPAEIKSFYMLRSQADHRLTDSVDLLMPNVGEIIGGSMRISDQDELEAWFKREGIDVTPYYWYIDQRKYGSCPHGGYGLGLERFLCWLLNRYHIREVCLYPRFVGRCRP